ncbi:VanZ family protein [Paenibacillus swuensis]
MALIFYFSSQTGDDLNSLFPLFQRWFPGMNNFDWGHFVAYFILALAYLIAFPKDMRNMKVKVMVVLFCFLYGLTDEFHQSFVGERTPDAKDLRNDTIGAGIAMLISSISPVKRWLHKL